jgi:hypothetical protein
MADTLAEVAATLDPMLGEDVEAVADRPISVKCSPVLAGSRTPS